MQQRPPTPTSAVNGPDLVAMQPSTTSKHDSFRSPRGTIGRNDRSVAGGEQGHAGIGFNNPVRPASVPAMADHPETPLYRNTAVGTPRSFAFQAPVLLFVANTGTTSPQTNTVVPDQASKTCCPEGAEPAQIVLLAAAFASMVLLIIFVAFSSDTVPLNIDDDTNGSKVIQVTDLPTPWKDERVTSRLMTFTSSRYRSGRAGVERTDQGGHGELTLLDATSPVPM